MKKALREQNWNLLATVPFYALFLRSSNTAGSKS